MKLTVLFFAAVIGGVSIPSWGLDSRSSFDGFVTTPQGRSLRVRYQPPRIAGAPVVAYLNGLNQSLNDWDQFHLRMSSHEFGFLRFDMYGQGESFSPGNANRDPIPDWTQVEDLEFLRETFAPQSEFNLIGLSYGGGVALQYLARYARPGTRAIIFAPLTEPSSWQESFVQSQVHLTQDLNRQLRSLFPFLSDRELNSEDLFNFYYWILVTGTYPLFEKFKSVQHLREAYRLALGIRSFRAHQIVDRLPEKSVHLIVAGADAYIAPGILRSFWERLPMTTRGSYLYLPGVRHKIPQEIPDQAAAWAHKILTDDPELHQHNEFYGVPLIHRPIPLKERTHVLRNSQTESCFTLY